MMKSLKIQFENSYKRDFKLVKKQGWNLVKIREVVAHLQTSEIIDPQYDDHKLAGNLQNFRECHIFGDLVIIYQRNDENLILYRIGRHQDLFKNY